MFWRIWPSRLDLKKGLSKKMNRWNDHLQIFGAQPKPGHLIMVSYLLDYHPLERPCDTHSVYMMNIAFERLNAIWKISSSQRTGEASSRHLANKPSDQALKTAFEISKSDELELNRLSSRNCSLNSPNQFVEALCPSPENWIWCTKGRKAEINWLNCESLTNLTAFFDRFVVSRYHRACTAKGLHYVCRPSVFTRWARLVRRLIWNANNPPLII